ncbi:15343_t:CDS:1, partial [Racocetra fulgida]
PNIIEQEQETDSENEFQDSADPTKNNLEKVLSLWESMLENEKLYDWDEEITDSLLNAELSSDILLAHEHPQRNKRAKWILGELFVNKLDPPSYINELYLLLLDLNYKKDL